MLLLARTAFASFIVSALYQGCQRLIRLYRLLFVRTTDALYRPRITTTLSVPHPGYVLYREYLRPNHISVEEFAADIGFSVLRVREIIQGERRITSMTALRLAGFFGTTPEFWLDLQARYDQVARDKEP